MIYRGLADLVVVIHFLFVAFIAIGALLALKWPALVWLHVPVVIWAAAIVAIGFTCPLTPLEKYFRERGGGTVYEGGFIDHYIRGVLYPGDFTVHARVIVALTIIGGYTAIVIRHRRRRARSDYAPSSPAAPAGVTTTPRSP